MVEQYRTGETPEVGDVVMFHNGNAGNVEKHQEFFIGKTGVVRFAGSQDVSFGAEIEGSHLACSAKRFDLVSRPGKCSRCHKNESQPFHTCPFAEEIHDDTTTLCDCCDECQHECCMEI